MASVLVFLSLLAPAADPESNQRPPHGASEAQTAQPNADEELAAQVRRLLRKLDAAQLQTRNEAEADLSELGPRVLDLLPAADAGSGELQQRLARVRAAIEQARAEAATKAATVTLHGKMPLSKALAEFEKQTGNKLIDLRRAHEADADDPEVDLAFEKTAFWPALDELLDQVSLTSYPYHYDGQDGLAINRRSETERPRQGRAVYAGPFRVEPTRIAAERHPTRAGPGVLNVEIDIAWEPRLRPIALRQSLAKLEAVDDLKSALNIDGAAIELEATPQRGCHAVQMSLPLAAPPRTAERLTTLRGELSALVPGPVEKFEFNKLQAAAANDFQPVEQTKGAATVVLEHVTHGDGLWEIWMQVRFADAATALESHRLYWLADNKVYLVGPDGKQIEHAGYEGTGGSENEVGFSYKFEAPDGELKDYKFVYETPAAIHVIPVEYEIKDLELP